MVEVAGVEPSVSNSQGFNDEEETAQLVEQVSQIYAQMAGTDRRDLSKLVMNWPKIDHSLRTAILSIVDKFI